MLLNTAAGNVIGVRGGMMEMPMVIWVLSICYAELDWEALLGDDGGGSNS
jgi:hypothetical protein